MFGSRPTPTVVRSRVAILLTCLASACVDDIVCASACELALINASDCEDCISCVETMCDSLYGRCRCGSAAGLRKDGACEDAGLPISNEVQCSPSTSYNLVLTVGLIPSPEVQVEDLVAGYPSPAMLSMIRIVVARALRLRPEEVALFDVTFLPRGDGWDQMSELPAFLYFDLSFSFCATTPTERVEPHSFETQLRLGAQRFQAFFTSSLYILEMSSQTLTSADQGPGEAFHFVAARPELDIERSNGLEPESSDNLLLWIVAALVASAVASLPLAFAALRLYQRRRKADARDSGFSGLGLRDGRASTGRSLEDGAIVCAHLGFDPEHQSGVSPGSCVALSVGDVLRVVADSGDGWLFGHIFDSPDRTGFFPEAHVSWIGSPVAATDPAAAVHSGAVIENEATDWSTGIVEPLCPGTLASQGYVAVVQQAFSPGEVEDEVFAQACLPVCEGDVLRITAGSGGWLHGEVVGMPERAGYFPEDRVSWVTAAPEQAAPGETPPSL